jgi:hypothetical protein
VDLKRCGCGSPTKRWLVAWVLGVVAWVSGQPAVDLAMGLRPSSGWLRGSFFVVVGLQPSGGWLRGSFFGLGISHFDLMWLSLFSFFAFLLN